MKKALLTSILAGTMSLTGCASSFKSIAADNNSTKRVTIEGIVKRSCPEWVESPEMYRERKKDHRYVVGVADNEYESTAWLFALEDAFYKAKINGPVSDATSIDSCTQGMHSPEGNLYFRVYRMLEIFNDPQTKSKAKLQREPNGNLSPSEQLIGNIFFETVSNTNSYIPKTKRKSYGITDLSSDKVNLMKEAYAALSYEDKVFTFDKADAGYDGNTETGQKDGVITGKEATTFYNFLRTYGKK